MLHQPGDFKDLGTLCLLSTNERDMGDMADWMVKYWQPMSAFFKVMEWPIARAITGDERVDIQLLAHNRLLG